MVPVMEDRVYSKGGRDYLSFWLIFFAFSIGLFALWSRELAIVPILMGPAYLGLFLVFRTAAVTSRDIFNPLCLVLVIGFIRFSCPAFLFLAGIEQPDEVALFYREMGLSESDWFWAHVLALTSVAGVALGWLVVRRHSPNSLPLHFYFPPGLSHAAVFGMLVGSVALLLFIVKNASLSAVVTGAIRSTTIQVGTGVYFRLSYMLIAGSILLSAYLLKRDKGRIALVPVICAAVALLTLGGRGRASIPLLTGLLLRWYHNRERGGWPTISFRFRHVLIGWSILLPAVWVLYFGSLYRGGDGLSALSQSLSLKGIAQYIQYAIFVDSGQLHALAGAVAIGPGVLGGETFFAALSWPLSKWLPMPGRSAGVFIIDSLVGFRGEDRWGVNASLIGDAYLNFGLVGIMFVMPLFGILAKLLYSRFRAGRLNAAIYAFAAVYGVGLFLKSIQAWENILVGLVFIAMIIRFGELLVSHSVRAKGTRGSTSGPGRLDAEFGRRGFAN
jgi:oligosaccharide repeat unit polymerase